MNDVAQAGERLADGYMNENLQLKGKRSLGMMRKGGGSHLDESDGRSDSVRMEWDPRRREKSVE